MIKEALQYIVDLKAPYVQELGGRMYADKPLTPILLPRPEPLGVATLTGLLDYISDNKDGISLVQTAIIHIKSPTEVLLTTAINIDANRNNMIVAKAMTPPFRYGEFYDSESFNIAIQSMFVDGDDRPTVIKIAGNLQEEAIKTSVDDGMTQRAVIKTGVKAVDYEAIPNPVTLRPYRTFIEVEQPASKFIFRAREGGRLALYEADGGAWRNEAIQNIKNYLAVKLDGLNLPLTILA